MSAARSALTGLVATLAKAVEPETVGVAENGSGGPATVTVRAASLTRLGRSQRDGAVLDLELVASVDSAGPEALELTERMLTALERESGYTVERAADAGLGFQVRMPVAVPLEEPARWRVSAPLRLDLRIARSVAGVVLDAEGHGVADARVRAALGGAPTQTDADGRFRLLVAEAPRQEFAVEVRGTTRTVDAATDTAPVVIRWE